MPTLTIKNVDENELESHRVILNSILDRDMEEKFLKEHEREALEGVMNMLDFWSDEKYFSRIRQLEKEAMDWLQNPTDADLDVIRGHMAEFVEWLDKQPEDTKQVNFWQWYEKGESHGNQN